MPTGVPIFGQLRGDRRPNPDQLRRQHEWSWNESFSQPTIWPIFIRDSSALPMGSNDFHQGATVSAISEMHWVLTRYCMLVLGFD
jgi:hypothetical protein